jgi:hypothetical protein
MQLKFAFLFVIVSLFSLQGASRGNHSLKAYLENYYPEVVHAIATDTYQMLQIFENHQLFQYEFTGTETGTSFMHAMLVGASMKNVDVMPRTNFAFSDLSFADLSQTNLFNVDFSNATLFHTDISYSTLDCGKIRGADLSRVKRVGTVVIVGGESRYASVKIFEECGAIVDKLERSMAYSPCLPGNKTWAILRPPSNSIQNDIFPSLFRKA